MSRLLALILTLLILSVSAPVCAEEMPVTAGDRLGVNVVGEGDLSGLFVVDQQGDIVIPLLGKIRVAGATPATVREEVARLAKKYVREPQVTVEFIERAQITVGITGMVRKPGPITLKKGSRLLDGLASAEGVTLEADEALVRLQRRGEPAAKILDLRKIDKEGALNLELKDGDAIFVPRIPISAIQVLGAVNKPGEVQRKDKMTLLEAVLAAGGLTADADKRKVQVLRKGTSQPTVVNLEDVLAGGLKNEFLQDGDTITIPAIPKVRVHVLGLVAKPGEAELKSGTTILEAVTAAGGFHMDADKSAVFLTEPGGEVRRVDLAKLDSPDGSQPLKDGTKLYIPQATPRRFAVAGGVTEPGLFPMPTEPGQKIYLTDALALAKGPIDRAKKKSIVLLRKNPNGGQPIVHQIDLEAILKRKDEKANLEIMVGDVVYVDAEPESRGRKPNVLERVLGIAGAFVGF